MVIISILDKIIGQTMKERFQTTHKRFWLLLPYCPIAKILPTNKQIKMNLSGCFQQWTYNYYLSISLNNWYLGPIGLTMTAVTFRMNVTCHWASTDLANISAVNTK